MLALLLVGAAPAAAEDTPAPTPTPTAPVALEATPTPAIGKVGTESRVTGRGWPAGAQVQVSICGNNALNGSADCDPKGSRSTSAAPDGTFIVTITFTRPPKPCPCVLHAYSPQTTQVVNYPVEIAGLPTATPVKDSSSRAATVTAAIDGSGPWTAWFGGAASRELVLNITNTGTLPINELPMTIYLGKGEDPTEFLTQARSGQVAPGETSQVVVPFELPALSFGSYTARTVIDGLDQQVTARADTSTYPWALLVVAWLIIQIPLLGLHRRRQQARFDDADLLELEDPFSGLPGAPAAPALVGAGVGASTGAAAAPAGSDLGGMAPWAAAMVAAGTAAGAGSDPTAGTAAVGPVDADPSAFAPPAAASPAGPALAVGAGAAGAAAGTSRVSVSGSGGSVVAGADTTYGVSHVRAFLDPAATAVAMPTAVGNPAAPGVPAGLDPVFAATLADPAYQAATAAPVPAPDAPLATPAPPVAAAASAPATPPAPPAGVDPVFAATLADPAYLAATAPPAAAPAPAGSPFGSPFVAAPPPAPLAAPAVEPAPAAAPPVEPVPPAEPVWTVPAGADPLDPATPLQPPAEH